MRMCGDGDVLERIQPSARFRRRHSRSLRLSDPNRIQCPFFWPIPVGAPFRPINRSRLPTSARFHCHDSPLPLLSPRQKRPAAPALASPVFHHSLRLGGLEQHMHHTLSLFLTRPRPQYRPRSSTADAHCTPRHAIIDVEISLFAVSPLHYADADPCRIPTPGG